MYFCIFFHICTASGSICLLIFRLIHIHHPSSGFICLMLQRRTVHISPSAIAYAQAIIIKIDWFKNKHETNEKGWAVPMIPRRGVWLTGCEVVSLGVLLASAAIHLGRYYWVEVSTLLFKVDNRWVGFAVGWSSSAFLSLYRDRWHETSTAPNNFLRSTEACRYEIGRVLCFSGRNRISCLLFPFASRRC